MGKVNYMTTWRGFLEESKSYMNHPDYWEEWKTQLYLANGDPDPDYPGWTNKDKLKAKWEFWRKFPRAWVRFYWSWLTYEVGYKWRKGLWVNWK